jgi:YVTN family beta-propeller protein
MKKLSFISIKSKLFSKKYGFIFIGILALCVFLISCGIVQYAIKPGKISANKILLSNGWSLSPAGYQIEVGDLPLRMAINPDQTFAVVTNNGYSKPVLSVVDLKTKQVTQSVAIKNTWLGIKFYNNGKKLAVSGGNENLIYLYDFNKGNLKLTDSIVIGKPFPKEKISIAGLDIDDELQRLYFVTREDNCFYAVDIKTRQVLKKIELKEQGYTCLLSRNNTLIYVSVWGAKKVLVIDSKNYNVLNEIEVESHPTDIIEDKNGKRVFVTNTNENSVSVIDVEKRRVVETISISLYPSSPCGSTPNSLEISNDGKKLYVANADNNCLVVVDISVYNNSKSSGFIPVGWYPTCVKCVDDNLLVLNGKGSIGSRENINGPQPTDKKQGRKVEYIGGMFLGSLSFIEYPDKAKLAEYSRQVYENSPYMDNKKHELTEKNPIPNADNSKSPIKYVFYIIKENRTYDQIFGDVTKGNGDPNLCLFPEKITPNHHKLANEFVLFDNFYVDAEVSADGHNWSMAAYATDYVEKTWPTLYGGRGGSYDYEGGKKISSPAKGYIWDYCKRHNVSYRVYGEFVENVVMRGDSVKPVVDALVDHVDPYFRGFDMSYKDVDRVKEWEREFDLFAKNGDLPSFQIIRLGSDHTSGTATGKRSPFAMVADNDLAVGMVIEKISKSKFWKESAIFILEDDAQNGPDHVDAHRSPVLIVSPFVKRGIVDSRMYSTSSVLRTMELVLGLPPMSQYDAAALPFYHSFTMDANFTPYEKIIPGVDMEEKNIANAYGQKECDKYDFSEADRIPDFEFSEIVWKSIKKSEMPPVRRSVFVMTGK